MNNRQLFLKHLAQTSDAPLMLEIVRAEGIYMYDASDKEYVDLISGIGVSNVGHRHPKIVKAIKDQVDKHLHLMVFGEFVQSPQVKLATALSKTLPEHLNSVYILNSGSEVVEGALKLAKRYTGKTKMISFNNAYHGSSHGALSVGGEGSLKQSYRPLLPEVYHLEYNNIEELQEIDSNTACVIIETIQGEAGVNIPNLEFLQALRTKCSEVGALLIFDEVQVGFGRTGKLWAFEHFGVEPDILLCAKGMGGGMPIGAFISSKEIMDVFQTNPVLGHISTFGGHPVSCAAALATLQVIQEENLLESVEAKGQLFKSLLVHKSILEIRQVGLFIAIEFDSYETNKAIIDKLLDVGIVTDWFLFNDCSLRIAPPLNISEEQIKTVCLKILEVL